jgi:hypothetical protein
MNKTFHNNTIYLKNINNKTLYFNDINQGTTICIKKCSDLKIHITLKINKIIIEKSQKILINNRDMIGGFEITKSSHILIKPILNTMIPFIGMYKSTVFLVGSIEIFLNIIINSELSELHNIPFQL